MRHVLAALMLLLTSTPLSAGPWELSVYSGLQTAQDSRVSGTAPSTIGVFSFMTGWESESFEAPPYWGIRATYWRSDREGFAFDFNHTKVIANEKDRADAGFEDLEFTDGLNVATVNYMRRFPGDSRWTPYVGVGVGLAMPHVKVRPAGGEKTEGYQLAGPAVVALAGVSYKLDNDWSIFGEYKGTYSRNSVDLDDGGTLDANIMTNAINFGVSYRF